MKQTVVNIMNFVRSLEPRLEMNLFETLELQLDCLRRHNLRSTLLLQYDVLLNPAYVSLIKRYEDILEVGVWLEMVRPLIEKAGLVYRGRKGWDWDYHSNVDYTIGYPLRDRSRIIDVVFKDFRSVFGYYPKTVASWIIDAPSLQYMAETYNITASGNCLEQVGIDGYTLWGGYPAAGFYPSKRNALCPAQTPENQIRVPIFRFSGGDPIHYYGGTHIYSIEPACYDGGGDETWTKWYFGEVLNNPCLSQPYVQTGQENSFGWKRFGQGFSMQCDLISGLLADGRIRVETMAETGAAYIRKFPLTPPLSRCFLSDWSEQGKKTVWYASRFYRANLLWGEEGLRIRDLFRFDEGFEERYLNDVETSPTFTYTNLEVVSGLPLPGGGEAGITLCDDDGICLNCEIVKAEETPEGLAVALRGDTRFEFSERRMALTAPGRHLEFVFRGGDAPSWEAEKRRLSLVTRKNGKPYAYAVGLEEGKFSVENGRLRARPGERGRLVFQLDFGGRYV